MRFFYEAKTYLVPLDILSILGKRTAIQEKLGYNSTRLGTYLRHNYNLQALEYKANVHLKS